MGRHNRYYDYTDNSNNLTQEAPVVDVPVENAGQVKEPEAENVSSEVISEPVPVQIVKGKVANCEMVNVRAVASSDCPIVSVIPKDEVVDIVGNDNSDYYKVITDHQIEGYIKKEFIEFI